MKVSPVRILLWVLAIVLLFALFLPVLSSMGVLLGSICFGWFSFLERVWPRISVSWSGVGMVALCSALILAGLHSLCAWLFAAVAAKSILEAMGNGVGAGPSRFTRACGCCSEPSWVRWAWRIRWAG